MSLKTVKRLASEILNCGKRNIRVIDSKKASEALTKEDVRSLIKEGIISKKPKKGIGRKKNERKKGVGSRKGSPFARVSRKERWIQKVKSQRKLLSSLKEKLAPKVYRKAYRMIKGNAFRDKRQLKTFLSEKMRSNKQ